MKYLKLFILTLFLICHFSITGANIISENDSIKVDSTLVKHFYNNFNNLTLGNIKSNDTSTILTSFYDPIDKAFSLYQTLSNTGLAHKNLELSYPFLVGFNSELKAFSSYIKTGNDIVFPIIYQPFTEINYMMGGKKEQHLNILFSREFLPRFFITLYYNLDFSPALYQRSRIQNSCFWGNFRYNTKNDRYGLSGYYFHNKIDIQENGGIKYDSIFTKNIESDRSVIDVNLHKATNLIKVSGFSIDQYFNILGHNIRKLQDSTSSKKRHHINIGRINYHFEYQRNQYLYEDEEPLSSFYHNFDPVLDSTLTYDSVYFHTIKNILYWNTLGYKKYNDDIPFYLTFGIEHNYTYHAGYKDIITNECFNKQKLYNLRLKAGIIINLFKSTRITGKGELITNDYHAGDFLIEGQWKQFLGTYKKNWGALLFDFNLSRQYPDWFEESYYSNNFRWDNDFSPSTSLLLKCSYELPFLTIGLKQTTIDHYIYFDADAKPNQYTGTLNIRSLYSTFNITLKHFEFTGILSFQTGNNEDIIHLPSFYGKIKLGYSITLVKNISLLQPSVIINYFTEYYADAYMPALRTFYLQNDIKVGNYPYIDFCLTFKIKRANIFVQYTNIYSLTKDYRYFTTPHYPMKDSRFCFGINWRLYK